MLLRHSTPRRNLPGIVKAGLLCSKSQGKRPVVWLHAPTRTSWAVLHTVKRHGGRVDDVVTLEIDVPRTWLKKHGRCTWYCTRDIPPDRIRGLITFAEVAGPSVAA
jgi:hypothetical protein